MAEKVVSGIQRILLPQLQEIKGELKAMNAGLDSVEAKVDSFRNEFMSEIRRLDERMDVNFKRLDEKVDGLSVQLETQRKLSVLEAKVAELERHRQ